MKNMVKPHKIFALLLIFFINSCWYVNFKRDELIQDDTTNNRRIMYDNNLGRLETGKERYEMNFYKADYGEDFDDKDGEAVWQ